MCEEILQRSTSCEDIQAVIALPIEIGEGEYFENLQDYVDLQQQQHTNIIERMRTEVEQLNLSVDKEIQHYTDVVKQELEWIKNELDDCTWRHIESVEQWTFFYDKNEKLKLEIASVIGEFDMDFKSLEKKRAENIRSILSKCKNEATKLRFLSIQDIENVFQDEIMDINKKNFTNFQTYEDIKLQLQTGGQEIIITSEQVLNERAEYVAEKQAQRFWYLIKTKQSQHLLMDTVFNLNQENCKTREDFFQVTSHLVQSLSEFSEVLQLPADYENTEEYWVNWIETLRARLDILDSLCQNVGGLLKTTIATLLESFDNQINMITRRLCLTFQEQEPEADETSMQIPTELEKLKKSQGEELKYLKTTWQDIIDKLENKIQRAKHFVLDITSIWINHLARINKAHKDLEASLESSQAKCLKQDRDKNVKIKSQIKAIREAKDLGKLNALCGVLEGTFIDLTDIWENNYEDQLDLVEGVKGRDIKRLIQEKLSEIHQFLNVKYPKNEWFSETSSPKLESYGSDIDMQIGVCNNYMVAVDNRTLGMYEMLDRYAAICEDALKEESEEWLNVYIQDIVNKYESHLDEINASHTKTLQEIRQVRAAELKVHSDRLLSHSSGVKTVLAELNQQYEGVKSNQQSLLVAFYDKLTNLNEDMPVKSTGQMKGTIFELQQDWNLLDESLQNHALDAKTFCENKCYLLKRSNELFSKTAQSFKSGGNYSPEELKTLKKELKQLEKTITSQQKNLLNNYNDLSKSISRQVLEATIEKMEEELNKATLQDNIVDNLNILRTCLRTEVNDMKTKGKAIGDKIVYLGSLGRMDGNFVNDILSMANVRHDYMVLPAGVLSLECSESQQKSAISINTATKSDKFQNKPVAGSDLLFKNATDEVSSDEKNFLARTKGLLLKNYTNLLQSVQETFKVKSAVTGSKSKTPSSKNKERKLYLEPDLVTDHIKRLKSTLQSYNIECELVWLGEAREFLNQMVSLRITTNSVIQQELENIHEIYMNRLESLENEHQQKVQEQLTEVSAKRDKIFGTLVLPLAHPTYQHKLDALYKQAETLCHIQNQNDRNLVLEYKDILQNQHNKYVDQVKALMESSTHIQSLVFDEGCCNILFKNSMAMLDLSPAEPIVKTENEKTSTETEKYAYPTSIWSDLDDSDYSRQNIPSSATSNGKSQINKLEEVKKYSINKIATAKIKESAEQIQKLYDKAKITKKYNEEAVSTWMKSLEFDINQAKLIYKPRCN